MAPSYALLKCPISEISVTGGLALRRVQLLLSFNLGEVGVVYSLCPMYISS